MGRWIEISMLAFIYLSYTNTYYIIVVVFIDGKIIKKAPLRQKNQKCKTNKKDRRIKFIHNFKRTAFSYCVLMIYKDEKLLSDDNIRASIVSLYLCVAIFLSDSILSRKLFDRKQQKNECNQKR